MTRAAAGARERRPATPDREARHADVSGFFVSGAPRAAIAMGARRPASLALVLAVVLCVAVPIGSAAAPAVSPTAATDRPAVTAETRCPDAPLVVRGGDAEDLADTCAGGAAAVAFFAAHGFDAPDRIDVEVVARMPPGYAPDAAGCYDPARRVVTLLDHVAFARYGRWMGRPIDRAMHRAIAAHEVAHALSACHFAMPRPSVIAREYVAYVAMFAAMAPALREHALAVHPDPPWPDDAPPDEADYAAEPMRFGARAWRHWRARPDPAGTLRAVLEGRLLGRDGRGP